MSRGTSGASSKAGPYFWSRSKRLLSGAKLTSLGAIFKRKLILTEFLFGEELIFSEFTLGTELISSRSSLSADGKL